MKVFELLKGGDMKRPAAARFLTLTLSVLALTFVGPTARPCPLRRDGRTSR